MPLLALIIEFECNIDDCVDFDSFKPKEKKEQPEKSCKSCQYNNADGNGFCSFVADSYIHCQEHGKLKFWQSCQPKEKKEEKRSCQTCIHNSFHGLGTARNCLKGHSWKEGNICSDWQPKQPPKEIDWEAVKMTTSLQDHLSPEQKHNKLVDIVRSLYEKVEGEKCL